MEEEMQGGKAAAAAAAGKATGFGRGGDEGEGRLTQVRRRSFW
jgi:hypothetical protein